ncbi:MAG TPA: (d)CMP kinase [Rhizomicrobium sp.]|jgi:cytidylate kinase|nr:(d)CMP kinase [Rhizomicrobium sp.]
MSIVIAVDGTAASGKGTLAQKLAQHFHFAHLDSGSLYRLVGLKVIEAGGDPDREEDAVRAARRLTAATIEAACNDGARIRSAGIGDAASIVSAFPEVRESLLQFQRDFAAHPPDRAKGAVIDGRDIGTVICPNATAKAFVDAKPEVRAHRRFLELKERGEPAEQAVILKELIERDRRDRERAVSPLRPASDALLLDTSNLDIDAAFAAALALVQPKVEEALKALPQGF